MGFINVPNRLEAMLLRYAIGSGTQAGMTPELYANVPAAVIYAVLENHAGMMSGHLPHMMVTEDEGEADEDGCQWAAAAPTLEDTTDTETPPPLEETDTEAEEARITMSPRSPFSTIHLGAPPPPPPPYPPPPLPLPTTYPGEISPPPQLVNVMISPIRLDTSRE